MQETGITFDHIHIISENPHAAASWYDDMLGGTIVASHEVQGAPQCVVSFGGATVIIRGRRPGEELGVRKALQWGIDHFGFHVAGDFDGFCEKIRRKGAVFTVEPTDFNPTLRLAFIEGPDGGIIELLQRKE